VCLRSFCHDGHGSGDFIIGFSTANRIEHEPIGLAGVRAVLIAEAKVIEGLFRAVVDCVEEAIANSLFGAETLVGSDDHFAWALPIAEVSALASLATNSRRRETP
jgi:D-aminopeptidase